jgi:type VI secretion system protein ImpL
MAFLKRPLVLLIALLIVLSCALWFAGPWFAFADYRPLASTRGRVISIGALWALSLIVLLVRRLKSGAVAEALTAALTPKPAPIPGRDVLQLRERFEEAIARLKAPYRRQREQRLYDLPWYVVIGRPGSGKTTAVHHSGLKFSGDGVRPAVRGIGGTRYCEWLCADQAVFIDTAGRYTTQDDGDEGGSAGWAEFLALLRRYRGRRPLNGVIVAISAEELLTAGDGGWDMQAGAIQRRLLELRRELRVRLPVYVMVTKCDLLSGFVEYFDDLDAEQRRQVWGVTFPMARSLSGHAASDLPAELDALIERLNARALQRVDEEREARRRPRIFAFPQQVAVLRAALVECVSEMFASARLDGQVLLRGVYLTSSTQEGMPVDRAPGILARAFGTGSEAVSPVRRKAFFVERMFKDVVLAESGIAGLNHRLEIRHAAAHAGAYAALLLLVAGGLWALSASYQRNRTYIDSLTKSVSRLQSLPAAGDSLASLVPRLDMVRSVADAATALQRDQWIYGWGLSQTGLVEAAQNAYRRELSVALRPRVAARLKERLTEQAAQPERLYEYLKAYLMLGHPERLDVKHLRFVAEMEWRSAVSPSSADAAVLRHFSALLERPSGLAAVPLDEALVAQARSTIRQASIPVLIYRQIRLTYAEDPRALRLDLASGVGVERVLRRRSGVPLSQPIPALCTAPVFTEIVTRDGADVVAQFLEEQWVWGAAGAPVASAEQLAAEVTALYEQDYIDAWERVLNDLEPTPIATVAQAKEQLALLSALTSPLRGVLKLVDEHTFLVKPQELAAQEKSIRERIVEALKNGTQKPVERTVPGARITAHFAAIHRLVQEQGGGAPLDAVLDKLKQIQQKLEPVGDGVGQVSARDPAVVNGVGEIVTSLRRDAAALPPAVGRVVSTVASGAVRVTRSDLNGTLATRYQRVMDQCLQVTSGRYPFANSVTDTPLKDFGQLFGYDGIFDTFFKEELAPLVDVSNGTLRWRADASGAAVGPSMAMLRRVEAATRIRNIFFKVGSQEPELRFRVTPVSLDAAATRVVLEIDGQRFEYRHGPERTAPAVWPGPSPGLAALSFEDGTALRPNRVFEGPWAWFRLFDVAERERDDVRFVLRYRLGAHDARIIVDALSIHAVEAMRELQQFRCGADS